MAPPSTLPLFAPHRPERSDLALKMVEAIRCADGVVIAPPGYHGTISGHIKNALDYVEDLSKDERPYLESGAVGCCSVAAGWQASVTTLAALRSVVHALRGWPTPLGISVNSAEAVFGREWLNPEARCVNGGATTRTTGCGLRANAESGGESFMMIRCLLRIAKAFGVPLTTITTRDFTPEA